MKQINSDLDSAILLYKSVSGFSEKTIPSKYRFSYASTQALKAEAKLWSAKVLAGGAADFNDAIAAIDEVEKAGLTLNADFKNVTGITGNSKPRSDFIRLF